MTKWKIYNEDAVEWAKNYQKGKFHALLCDAPYHLTSIVKRFGKKNSAPAQFGTDGVFSRASKGFMGSTWDGGDLAFRPETWEAFGEVLYPGAFGMSFSASRNWHRMAVAIEDAGFILHPTIFLWAYGQGFPKATRIDTQIQPREKTKRVRPDGKKSGYDGGTFNSGVDVSQEYTKATDPLAQIWEGYRYGLQALKPAVEPIIVFQKPYEGRPLDNIVETGAGALNIDDARIPTQDEYVINRFEDGMKPFGNGAGHKYTSKPMKWTTPRGGIWETDKDAKAELVESNQGRWPSNLILTEESAKNLDAQTGILTSGAGQKKKATGSGASIFDINKIDGSVWEKDSGGASRFFYNVSQQLDESDPVYYCGKVSPKERNAGLHEFPEVERSYMNTHNGNPEEGESWHPIDDRTGEERDRFKSKSRNPHPTLKPIDLCKYLATLLLPPIEYAPRRIFIPFSGVASEMIGAGLAGWEHVVGVEFDTENGYVDIAKKRIEHWLTVQAKSS